jgi:hypothetical protein
VVVRVGGSKNSRSRVVVNYNSSCTLADTTTTLTGSKSGSKSRW